MTNLLATYMVQGDFFMIKCEIDGKEFKNGGVLARHLKKLYKLTYKEYFHKYVLKSSDVPKCKCGCGENVDWTNVGYRDYKGKHWIVVKNKTQNSWGHNPEAIEKSAETRRKQFASGERTVWIKGLTKESDSRIKELGKRRSAAFTKKIRGDYSIRMSKMRKDGTIPTLYGKDSSRWEGGVSSIQQIARANKILYQDWKYPILVRDGFKCTQCSNTAPLHVHHDKETFSSIIKKVMTLEDCERLEEFDRKKDVSDRVVQYHVVNKVSGVTLCEECHKKLHPSLNL